MYKIERRGDVEEARDLLGAKAVMHVDPGVCGVAPQAPAQLPATITTIPTGQRGSSTLPVNVLARFPDSQVVSYQPGVKFGPLAPQSKNIKRLM